MIFKVNTGYNWLICIESGRGVYIARSSFHCAFSGDTHTLVWFWFDLSKDI